MCANRICAQRVKVPVTTPDKLPATAHEAWQAYLAMRDSKAAYFTLLTAIDQRSRGGGEPTTIAESLLLEKLLGAHSMSVQRFGTAMAAVTDPAAREALIRAISALSTG